MKSPKRRGEVTKEWVEFMLTEFENRSSPGSKVIIKSWTTGDATKKGDGYSGDLIKLEVKASVQNNNKELLEKEYHHIIKFTSQDPIQKELVKVFGGPKREFFIYSEIIEELNKFQANLTNNMYPIYLPTYVFGRHNDKEHVLVMENMKIHGYENKSKKEFLNFDEAKIALEQLARLHAISYAYDKQHNILEKYPILNAEYLLSFISLGLHHIIDMVVDFLKFQGEHEDLINKILASKTEMVEKAKKAFISRDQPQIFCINHGDPWNNNILLRQSEGNINVNFIDWEIAHWNTSAYDLNYFFGGALTPEIRLKHQDELLQHYHAYFTEVTNTLGSHIPYWGYEDFKKEYDTVSFWGLLKGLGFVCIISEASKDWQMSNHNPTTNPVMKSIKKGFGKFMVSIMFKPSVMEKFGKKMMKSFIDPVLKEMKTGKTPELNERFLSYILEGDKGGFFDLHLK